jgi:hypothetical protein
MYAPYHLVCAIDFKYGAGNLVDVEENKQLMQYALGVYFAIPEEDRETIERVRLIIFQPRIPDGVQSIEFEVTDLLEFHKQLLDKARDTENFDAPLSAGEWCKYCPAQLGCSEFERYTSDELEIQYAPVPMTPDFTMMDAQKLSKFLKAETLITKAFENAKQYALGLILKGEDVPGFEAKKSLGNREWIMPVVPKNSTVTGEEVLANLLQNKFGNYEYDDNFFERKFKSPKKVEDLAKSINKNIDLSEFTTRQEKGWALSKIKGKAAKIALIDEFAALLAEKENDGI